MTSGWNDVASRCPCRTATILPAAGPVATRATTWTPAPVFSTHGARMNTAWNGSANPATSRSASKESTWRPKALRRTTTSRPPMVSWPAVPPSMRSASRIIPAQVPKAGSPPDAVAQRLEQAEGPGQLVHRGRLAAGHHQAVDGVQLARTAYGDGCGRRTLEHRECSRTSPCSASTPMRGLTMRSACASRRRPRSGPRRSGRPGRASPGSPSTSSSSASPGAALAVVPCQTLTSSMPSSTACQTSEGVNQATPRGACARGAALLQQPLGGPVVLAALQHDDVGDLQLVERGLQPLVVGGLGPALLVDAKLPRGPRRSTPWRGRRPRLPGRAARTRSPRRPRRAAPRARSRPARTPARVNSRTCCSAVGSPTSRARRAGAAAGCRRR